MEKQTYTVDEAAKILGLSRNATYKAALNGSIPTIRVGKRILVPIKALEEWLASAGE